MADDRIEKNNLEKQNLFIHRMVERGILLVDSSVVMSPFMDKFWSRIYPIACKEKNTFYMVYSEFKRIVNEKKDGKDRNQVAQDKITQLVSSGQIHISNEENSEINQYADFFRCTSMSTFCIFVQTEWKAALIKKQAIELGIAEDKITFCKINKNGSIWRMNELKPYEEYSKKQNKSIENWSKRLQQDNFRFNIVKEIVRVNSSSIQTDIPLSYQSVRRSDGSEMWLKEQHFVSADSITYSTDVEGYDAKIYKQGFINTYIYEKCKLMISHRIYIEGVCWPEELLYNKQGHFVGVLIKKAEGYPLHLAVFKTEGLKKYFPEWKRVDLVNLSITILKIIKRLHNLNIFLGCINPASILVVDSKTVFFVDCDDYQIEGFPCLLRNITFTPPEFQMRRNEIYLESRENENFAVAVLAFMILLPGKMPYSRSDGNRIEDNIVQMRFPYAYKENRSEGVPPGFWRFVWSHLTDEVKRNFFHTFRYDGNLKEPEKRNSVGVWLGILERYQRRLEDGTMRKNDPDSESLFPKTFKHSKDCVYLRCVCCDREYVRNRNVGSVVEAKNEYICHDCWSRKTDVNFVCEGCGKRFYYSIGEMYIRRKNALLPQKRCFECASKKEICRSCGKEIYSYKIRDGICDFCRETVPCTSCGKRMRPQYLKNGRCKECNTRRRTLW